MCGDDWIARVTSLYDAIRASYFLTGVVLHPDNRHAAGVKQPAERRLDPEGCDRTHPPRRWCCGVLAPDYQRILGVLDER
ncbi:hypothetical protein PH213_35535 [Streptomyces sp. SRF1]|uniref:hypothetical protein n=1 Tax=Streptomyces sp. SRF1 TaxID=1549642 RepID=UPI0025AFAA50|nr:hypothetical protein [Streptomyces sp. SRF1]MDN3059750.1 hypothetical protein [Streptomyces sp. SRF1]